DSCRHGRPPEDSWTPFGSFSVRDPEYPATLRLLGGRRGGDRREDSDEGEGHRDASDHVGPPLLEPATIDGEGAKTESGPIIDRRCNLSIGPFRGGRNARTGGRGGGVPSTRAFVSSRLPGDDPRA